MPLDRASTTMTGPRSNSPTPMLTRVLIGLPVYPFHALLRTASVNSMWLSIRSIDVLASEQVVAVSPYLRFTREQQKHLQNELGYKVLGEIDEHDDIRPARRILLLGEFEKPLTILCEQ